MTPKNFQDVTWQPEEVLKAAVGNVSPAVQTKEIVFRWLCILLGSRGANNWDNWLPLSVENTQTPASLQCCTFFN